MDKKYYKVILDLPKLEYFTGQVFISDGNGYYNLFGYPVRPKVHSEFVEGNPISFRQMTSEEISDFNNFFSDSHIYLGVDLKNSSTQSELLKDVAFEKGTDLVTDDSSVINHLRSHAGNKSSSKEKEEEVISLRKESSELEKAISDVLSKGISVQEIMAVLRDVDSPLKKESSKNVSVNTVVKETLSKLEDTSRRNVDNSWYQKRLEEDREKYHKCTADNILSEKKSNDYVERPTLGVKPQWLWVEQRVNELWDYIVLLNFNAPDHVVQEFTEHIQWLKQRKKNTD